MSDRERLIELIRKAKHQEYIDAVTADIDTAIDMPRCEEYLADHLLANGVIVPPCKVGDTVYQTDSCRVYQSEIDYIEVHGFVTIFYADGVAFDERAIGDSIFLSREEAEKALAERRATDEKAD